MHSSLGVLIRVHAVPEPERHLEQTEHPGNELSCQRERAEDLRYEGMFVVNGQDQGHQKSPLTVGNQVVGQAGKSLDEKVVGSLFRAFQVIATNAVPADFVHEYKGLVVGEINSVREVDVFYQNGVLFGFCVIVD